MKLSARSRYASRILLELAKHKSVAPMSAAMLSQHTGVSVQFVEQTLKPLKQNGLTQSIRGAAGGHKLARPAESITLGEVVRLMEGGIFLTVCCGEKANNCPRREGCLTRKAWIQVSRSLEKELDSITLATLAHGDQVCPEDLGDQEKAPAKNDACGEKSHGIALLKSRVPARKVKGLRR
mgnify:CR=1 FL=1